MKTNTKKKIGAERSNESIYLPNRFLPSRHEKIRGAFICKQTQSASLNAHSYFTTSIIRNISQKSLRYSKDGTLSNFTVRSKTLLSRCLGAELVTDCTYRRLTLKKNDTALGIDLLATSRCGQRSADHGGTLFSYLELHLHRNILITSHPTR